jgi:DNA repair ATPase RecN
MNEDHTCIRQEDFDQVRRATSDLQGDLRVNTEMTARLETAMTRMAESIQKLSECTIEMKATQVTSEVFNKKFESLESRFREQKDLAIKASEERDEILHQRVDKAVKIIDRHDVYFWIMGTILLLLAANAFDLVDLIRKIT